jgi:hypothetical protein
MGCRCNERKQAISRAASAVTRGDLKTVAQSAGFVTRTLAQDVRSGALRQAATQNLARLRTIKR